MATKVRNVRLDENLDEKLVAIAESEQRSVSNMMTWFISDGVEKYIAEHPDKFKEN